MAVSAVKKEPAKPTQKEPAKPQQGAPAPAPAAQPKPAKKGGWLPASILMLLVLGAAGGGAWWHMERDGAPTEAKPAPAKPPVFAPLEAFTVNLQNEEHSQYLQVGLTLRLAQDGAIDALKQRMPEVRDRILLLLSSKKAPELLTLEGKRKLAAEIQAAVNSIIAPAPEAPAAPKAAAQPAEGTAAEGTAPEAPAEAPAAAAPAAPAPVPPVTAVLFTSFIVQ